MINVSKAFKQELYNGRQDYLLSAGIVFADGTEKELNDADIWENGISVEDAVSSDNSFDIGAAITNRCTLVINNMYDKFSAYDFTGAEVVPYVKLELPDGTIEPVRKGTFTVDEADYDEELITLSCLDNMWKFDKPYSLSRLVYPATLGEIVRDACSACGVYLQTQDFPHKDFIVQNRPADEAATFREVISWAAQIACCFCRCDVYGRLELKWYDTRALETAALDGGAFKPWTSGNTIDGGTFKPWTGGTVYDGGTFGDRDNIHHIYSNFSVDIATDDVVITGVRVLEKTKEDDKEAIVTYQSGADGYVISIENNDLIQGGAGREIADWLGEQLIGLRFRPASISHLSDPTIEGGDVGFFTDRKGRTYRIVVSNTRFTAGDSQNTSCNAKTPARNSATRYSAETKAYVENRKNFEKERTDRQLALDTLAGLMKDSPGMYMTEEPPGGPNAVRYFHDKPTIEDSKNVIKFTAEAIGISNNGGKTYPYGLILTGDAILNKIYTIGLDAGYIKTGILSVGDTGKETLYVNFATGEVRIRPKKFSLDSGETIEDIAKSSAASMWNDKTKGDFFNKLVSEKQGGFIEMNEKGEIYINASLIKTGEMSASYIRGGELKLGGSSNKYGRLSVVDASDANIASIGYSGIQISKGYLRVNAATSSYESVVASYVSGSKKTTVIVTPSGVKIRGENIDGYSFRHMDLFPNGLFLSQQVSGSTAQSNASFNQNGIVINECFTATTTDFRSTSPIMRFPNLEEETSSSYGANLHIGSYGYIRKTRTSSSKRYKDILRTFREGEISSLYQITPVWAKYKEGHLRKDDERNGEYFPMLIAEDVAQNIPLAADHNAEGGVEDWNFRVLIPCMIQALKEQHQEIETLKLRMCGEKNE